VAATPTKDADVVLAVGAHMNGRATWYGGKHHGGPTASGERFNKHKLTAAHRTLPMNATVRVTAVKSKRSVVVRINDRGPYGKDRGRIIDVSEAAARKLGMMDAGVIAVTVEIVSLPPPKAKRR
jgi:rare lipoprotein A